MGHLRLGSLPDTAPWRQVVQLLAEGADVSEVVIATTEAALEGLDRAHDDDGLAYTVWLLAQTVLASRSKNFSGALATVGVHTVSEPDVFDIAAGFTEAVDRHLLEGKSRTDLGEIAQLAGVETLSAQLARRSANLFETTHTEVQAAARECSTQKGFADLAHNFFACFARRFLTYHLSRELSNHVGGNGCFAEPEEHSAYLDKLDIHCREVAGVARRYAGEWYSKTNFEGGITPSKARRFANHVLKKLRDGLLVREARHG